MKRIVGTALGILVVMLSVAGIAQAQCQLPATGRIEAVNCQTDVLFMSTTGGIELFSVAPNTTVFINSTPASFCTLSQYVGSYAIVSGAAEGSQRTVGRVDVLVPPPAYDPYSAGYPYYGPFVGGTPTNPMFNRGGVRRR